MVSISMSCFYRLALLLSLCSFAFADANQKSNCFTWGVPTNLTQEIEQAFAGVLDAKNKDILPGLPESDFPFREISRVAQIGNSVLVFVAYRDRQWDVKNGRVLLGEKPGAFYQVFQYRLDSKSVSPLVPPMNDNQSSRMWQIEPALLRDCGSVDLEITFRVCVECCAGQRYTVHLTRDSKSKSWTFSNLSKTGKDE